MTQQESNGFCNKGSVCLNITVDNAINKMVLGMKKLIDFGNHIYTSLQFLIQVVAIKENIIV